MRVFVSYSSRDGAAVKKLVAALRHAHEVWYDDELGGGQEWWNAILERIRGCDIVVFAMSNRSLKSQPCQAELAYAQALQRPILPVQVGAVDTMRAQPLAALHVVDYRQQTPETGVRLFQGVQELHTTLAPLPEPLPPPPAMPFANIARLDTALAVPQLSPHEQAHLVFEMRTALQEIGDDPLAQRDIARLLDTLGNRPDVTHQTRAEVDTLRTSLGASARRRKVVLIAGAVTLVALVCTLAIWLWPNTPNGTPTEPEGVRALELTYLIGGKPQNIRLSDARCISRDDRRATVDVYADPPAAEDVMLPNIDSPQVRGVAKLGRGNRWQIQGNSASSAAGTNFYLTFTCP
jgi:hypothetical protein